MISRMRMRGNRGHKRRDLFLHGMVNLNIVLKGEPLMLGKGEEADMLARAIVVDWARLKTLAC